MGRKFTVQGTNQNFTCQNCGFEVPALQNGSVRNHCPRCLHSLHVDIQPGDRANPCKGMLEPVAVEHNAKKGWIIVHKCKKCGEVSRNKAALDDPTPDDYDLIIKLTQDREPLL
ncbi:RNHCP domain-containing protein [Deinococcus roseus]|uniref:RNHCP domain-containing protein n=1 Tax=Deinococcus roseus TaxID=392414 RepID=A0ABQ2CT09_9DEIO|nr:RNHCP domain-containing protein [Deinococcus roseus]GGJ18024.1 RNHCP domain-containing protein [Deinococcus roseus]